MSATLSQEFIIWNNAFFNICDARVICENYVNSDSKENFISPLVLISNISRLHGKKKIFSERQQTGSFVSQKAYPLH